MVTIACNRVGPECDKSFSAEKSSRLLIEYLAHVEKDHADYFKQTLEKMPAYEFIKRSALYFEEA